MNFDISAAEDSTLWHSACYTPTISTSQSGRNFVKVVDDLLQHSVDTFAWFNLSQSCEWMYDIEAAVENDEDFVVYLFMWQFN